MISRHWRSRATEVRLPMTAARRMWGRAWRVDTHVCERLGTRRATILLCAEDPGSSTCAPIGWCSMFWHLPEDAETTLDHLAWDDEGGATEDDAWRAIAALAGRPVARPAQPGTTVSASRLAPASTPVAATSAGVPA